MGRNYVKGKGILIGTFNEDDIANKRDKIAIEKAMIGTGYQYVHSEYVKKNGKIVGLRIYICDIKDADFSFNFKD